MRGEPHPVLTSFAADLGRAGNSTLLLDGDWSDQAAASNDFSADVYLGIVVVEDPVVEAAYFQAPGYESAGGRRLAELVVREFPAAPGWVIGAVQGMRLPILRETRPPAVLLTLGTTGMVDANSGLVVAALHRALRSWSTDPC
jgi:N-acetylmuramoyl-L-alanine amidase